MLGAGQGKFIFWPWIPEPCATEVRGMTGQWEMLSEVEIQQEEAR